MSRTIRKQIGFYAPNDVQSIIDEIPKSEKSAYICAAIRCYHDSRTSDVQWELRCLKEEIKQIQSRLSQLSLMNGLGG